MQLFRTYMGLEPFSVALDDSPQLQGLTAKSREMRQLPFPQKLQEIRHLSLDAMVNAYEQMIIWGKEADELEGVTTVNEHGQVDHADYLAARAEQERYSDIVFNKHPLSHALKNAAGCCRYQAALFFVLGFEAWLGDSHYLQAAEVNSGVNTTFNEIINQGDRHKVSIFIDSLKEASNGYLQGKPNILSEPVTFAPGVAFYSYHMAPQGPVIVEHMHEHIRERDLALLKQYLAKK